MSFKKLLLIPVLLVAITACGVEHDNEETAIEQEVLQDDPTAAAITPVIEEEEPTIAPVGDDEIEKAYKAFLAQGVPVIALKQAFDFYRENRASVGGLKETSCLLTPMSETGEIPKNSNRYDPTTKALLKKGIRNERYIVIADYTDTNTEARGYILDLYPDKNGEYSIFKTTLAHGYGSQAIGGIPQVFTNAANHGTTVSGFFITAAVTYPYYGSSKSAGGYSSTGLRMYGVESTNNTAERTSKVSHGAPYVTDSKAGNSAGCPAMTQANAKKWLPVLKGGVLWYHYTKINKSASYKSPSCKS